MSAVKLTGNFLATARCLIFADGGGITWTFNSNTNTLQASGSGGGVTGLATPTAKVGLTAVAGAATTAIRSDGAPALDQSIIPTWTGLHTFDAGLTVSAGVVTISGHTLALSANATVGGSNTGDQAIPTGTNPSATIALSAVNGTADTFMTSDSAPALSQAIVPTWTALHTFTGGITFTGQGSTFKVNPTAETGFSGVTIGNASSSRKLELVYIGTGRAAAYGIQPGNSGINAQNGSLCLSVSDAECFTLVGAAASGAKTITILLTDFPGTNAGSKTPTYIPITIGGAKFWIQAIPD